MISLTEAPASPERTHNLTEDTLLHSKLFLDFLEERFVELLTQALNDEIACQTLEGLTIEDIENVESMLRTPSPPLHKTLSTPMPQFRLMPLSPTPEPTITFEHAQAVPGS